MPSVSVIIPTHNRASMVKEAIQSVLSQTYKDFELIVVDDGSTDNTHELVTSLSDKVVYVYQPNNGRSSARNHGIRLARGKYIAFLDSDDLFLPTKLQKQVSLMEKNNDYLLSHTSYQHINAEGDYIGEVKSGTFSGNVYPKIIRRCVIATPTVMVRSEALSEDTSFNETISIGEDAILWIQLARKSKILGINEPLTKVRISGISAAFDLQAQITGVTNIIEYTVKREPDLSPTVRRSLLSDGYLKIGFSFLMKHEGRQFLKYFLLALRNSPFYAIYWVLTALYAELFTRRWLRKRAKLVRQVNSLGE
jgi:glycosyltransferase involved in cell wall biosynthesis